jgi:hypothetical protein
MWLQIARQFEMLDHYSRLYWIIVPFSSQIHVDIQNYHWIAGQIQRLAHRNVKPQANENARVQIEVADCHFSPIEGNYGGSGDVDWQKALRSHSHVR